MSPCTFFHVNFSTHCRTDWTSSENIGVPARPEIKGITKPATEGDVITLTCTTTGSKPAARIQWLRNDKEVQGKLAMPCGLHEALHESSATWMSSHLTAAFFFWHHSSSLGFTCATIWLSGGTVLLLSLELVQILFGCIGTLTQQTCSLWDHYNAL